MEAIVKPTHLEILKIFDLLPADSIVPDPVGRIVTNFSERSWRRNRPVPKIMLGERLGGCRVGDLRKVIRGEVAPAA